MMIGEIARRSGVAIETIRYYEREGLLLEPIRKPSGYRLYEESTVDRLDYIKRAKDLGFTLSEIRELLELSFSTLTHCVHIRERAESKIAEIEDKICKLRLMKRSLSQIVLRCRCENSAKRCPLVHKTTVPAPDCTRTESRVR